MAAVLGWRGEHAEVAADLRRRRFGDQSVNQHINLFGVLVEAGEASADSPVAAQVRVPERLQRVVHLQSPG